MKPIKLFVIILGAILINGSLGLAFTNPAGDYLMSQFDNAATGGDPWSVLAAINLDGNGNGTFQDLYTSDPDPSGGSEPFSYAVIPDGRLTISPGIDTYHGIVSPDAGVFTIAMTSGDHLGINIGIKKSSGMSNASASGDYLVAEFDKIVSGGIPWAGLTAIHLAGDGTGTWQQVYKSDPGDPENGSFTYSIDSDGGLTLTLGPDVLHGIVSADGSIFSVARTSGDMIGIMVGIKKSSGMSNGSADGRYIMSGFENEVIGGNPWSGLAAINLDGNGNGTIRDLYTSDTDPLESGSFTYLVSSDGSLTINAGSDTFHGIVSADGTIYTLVRTTGAGIEILVGIEKSPLGMPHTPLLLLGD